MAITNSYTQTRLFHFLEVDTKDKRNKCENDPFEAIFPCIYSQNQKTEFDFFQPGNAEDVLLVLHYVFLKLWSRSPQGDLTAWQKPMLTYYKGTGDGQEYVS